MYVKVLNKLKTLKHLVTDIIWMHHVRSCNNNKNENRDEIKLES